MFLLVVRGHYRHGLNQISSSTSRQLLRVLVIEDSEDDTTILLRELRSGGFEPEYLRVETAAALNGALDARAWDLVISDYVIPGFGGLPALEIFKRKQLDVPFIVLSGHIGEDMAVRLMKSGAHDYIMKDQLARLVPAITRELRDAAVRRERRETESALRESEERFRQLAENIDSAFFMFERSADGQCNRLLYANPSYECIWGRSRESLYSDSKSWLKAVHPDDLDIVQKSLPSMERGEFNQEFRIVGFDLQTRWIRYRTFPVFDAEGAVYRIAGIAEDVTERRTAEEKLAANARQLDQMVEELKLIDEQLKESNQAMWESRRDFERRVHERTAALSVANAELQNQIHARTRLEGELLEIAERERHRRGLEIHTAVSQKLMGMSFMLKALENKIVKKNLPTVEETRQIQALINEVVNHTDDLAQDFNAADSQGGDLARDLKNLAAKLRKTFQISCQFSSKGAPPTLSRELNIQLYKIALEAASSAIKHGNATVVTLGLICEPAKLSLVVTDNGKPFDRMREAAQGGEGCIMNSRASMIGAELLMQPQAEKGMIVTCKVPVSNDGAAVPGRGRN